MFNGKNSFPSLMGLMYERIMYKLTAYPEKLGVGPPVIKDLNFAELNYYGRVDHAGRSIYPDEGHIVDLPSSNQLSIQRPESMRALSFVANMYQQVKTNISIKVGLGKLFPANRAIATMTPERAYEPPLPRYEQYLDGLLIRYNENFIPRIGTNLVTSYESYIKYFLKYLKESSVGSPVTFTSWIRSSHNSIYGTGLAIGLLDKPADVDHPKGHFVYGPMFDYYKKILMNKGFSIVHNVPWCIVADLGSPAMDFTNIAHQHEGNHFINTYFKSSRDVDLEIIQSKLKTFYNNFVLVNDRERYHTVTCSNTIITSYRYRSSVGLINEYDLHPYWLQLYAEIRNIEEKYPMTQNEVKNVFNRAKKLDMQGGVRYIDSWFAKYVFKKPWGISYVSKRLNSNKQQELEKKLAADGPSTSSSGGGGTGGGMTGGY